MTEILLITKEYQPDVDDVLKWLIYYKAEFVRITPSTEFEIKKVHISNSRTTQIEFIINNKVYNLHNFKSIWIANGILPQKINQFISQEDQEDIAISTFLYNEWRVLTTYIFNNLENLKCIGSVLHGVPNKLAQLEVAKACELKIPETFIVNNSSELVDVGIDNFITKPINEVFTQTIDNNYYYSRTSTLSVTQTTTNRFPFLVQNHVQKKIELRIFYFYKEFYSTAIFSQEKEKSQTDWRMASNSIRFTPYKLPGIIEGKLIRFMDLMKLNTGSIDLIVTPNNEFVFLEVNPAGIFQNVSELANFNIHKIIAEKLISYGEN